MKILLIRHGDPDYEKDSLTEKGWHEAELLAQRMAELEIQSFYVSPLGRAKDTASCTLKKMGREAEELAWLREFHAPIPDFHTGEPRIPWDQLPADWTAEPKYYDNIRWAETLPMLEGHVIDEANRVWKEVYKRQLYIFDRNCAPYGIDCSQIVFYIVHARNPNVIHVDNRCVLAVFGKAQHTIFPQIGAEFRFGSAGKRSQRATNHGCQMHSLSLIHI